MSLTPLFLYGKGQHGESHGEEKEEELEIEDLKAHKPSGSASGASAPITL
jgi:hypothetical protein